MDSVFKDRTLMITGGTGSFGHTVLKHFLATDIGQIRIFSRDEKKQDDMRHELQAKYPDHAKKVKFYVGDVRDRQSLDDAMPGVDYIFHVAALKAGPVLRVFPDAGRQDEYRGNRQHATCSYRRRCEACRMPVD